MAQSQTSWKKRILIPFWSVRILFMVIIIGFYAWALNYVRTHDDFENVALGLSILFMLLLVICLLLDILAIVMFARGTLKPGVFLIFNLIQTIIWAIVLVLDIVAVARDGIGRGGLIGSFIVFISFLGLLIYAIFTFLQDRKLRKRGHGENPTANPASVPLVQPHQPQAYGYTDPPPPLMEAPHPQPTAAPYYQPAVAAHYQDAQMPAELPASHGAASSYYSGAPTNASYGKTDGNPFADPPAYGQQPSHAPYP